MNKMLLEETLSLLNKLISERISDEKRLEIRNLERKLQKELDNKIMLSFSKGVEL